MSVMQERTNWRDLAFSRRHRYYGNDCCAVDLDYLPFKFNEYYNGEPVALIEYKHENAAEQDYSKPNFQALIRLGDRAELPVFCVYYAHDMSWYIGDPLNDYARKIISTRTRFTEFEYVRFLHDLRGVKVHDNYIEFLLKKADEKEHERHNQNRAS